MTEHNIIKQIAVEPYRYTIALGFVDSIFGILEKSINDLTSGVFSSQVNHPIKHLNVASKDALLDLLENIYGGINSDEVTNYPREIIQQFFGEKGVIGFTNSSELGG